MVGWSEMPVEDIRAWKKTVENKAVYLVPGRHLWVCPGGFPSKTVTIVFDQSDGSWSALST